MHGNIMQMKQYQGSARHPEQVCPPCSTKSRTTQGGGAAGSACRHGDNCVFSP